MVVCAVFVGPLVQLFSVAVDPVRPSVALFLVPLYELPLRVGEPRPHVAELQTLACGVPHQPAAGVHVLVPVARLAHRAAAVILAAARFQRLGVAVRGLLLRAFEPPVVVALVLVASDIRQLAFVAPILAVVSLALPGVLVFATLALASCSLRLAGGSPRAWVAVEEYFRASEYEG